jgi:TonB family protein
MPDFSLTSKNQEVEIVYQNETPQRRQVVTDPNVQDIKEALEKLKDKAKYLSRVTKRVKEEVIAQKTGETRNQLQQQAQRELQKPIEEDDQPSINKVFQQNIGRNTRVSDSSISEYIPEVKTGGFSALNSDQFIHYTFYARINEQIRNRWTANIAQFLNSSAQSEVNRLAQKPQISQIEIVLNPSGHFLKAIIHQKSENPQLDQSAINAFRLASPFLNPPSEMIESDGNIHLHYGFHVHFRPRYIASGSK